jgi:hypothetical protein
MFGASPGFGKVSVSALDTRVLVAVAELPREACIGVVVALFAFSGALGAVGIIFRNPGHGQSSAGAKLCARAGCNSQFPEPLAGLQRFVGSRIALDDVAKFGDAIFLFAKFN